MKNRQIFGFAPNVLALSTVSCLNDIGGETIKRAIPLYLANILGVKTSIIGLVEGIADSTPQLFQPISGLISDYLQKRKFLVMIGQIMRSGMILLFWATSWPAVLALRFLDRSGKGIANAPRDALIAGSSRNREIGRSFGLNRAMDNTGAVLGMVLAGFIVFNVSQQAIQMNREIFQRIVLLSVIPLIISLSIIFWLVKDIPRGSLKPKIIWRNRLGKKFYIFLFFSFIFTLGNSSDAFLVLKAQLVGLPLGQIFWLLAAYSLVSAVSGLPLSILSDKLGRKKLLFTGWLLYSVVYLLFARANSSLAIIMSIMFYGLYYGFSEGSAKALIADITDSKQRGTAYGLYNLVVGGTLLPASIIAGFLWQNIAPQSAFYFGSLMAFIGAVGLAIFL